MDRLLIKRNDWLYQYQYHREHVGLDSHFFSLKSKSVNPWFFRVNIFFSAQHALSNSDRERHIFLKAVSLWLKWFNSRSISWKEKEKNEEIVYVIRLNTKKNNLRNIYYSTGSALEDRSIDPCNSAHPRPFICKIQIKSTWHNIDTNYCDYEK